MIAINPFPVSEYISPEYFCDRESELEQLTQSINNGRNLTIVSRRRMGKTALIRHCFYHLQHRKDLSLHYFDIYPTQNLNEFINMLTTALIGYFESKPEKVISRLTKLLGGFRPKFSFDEYTGKPYVELTLQNDAHAEQSLSAVFQYLSQQQKRIVLAIDEFQQITSYPEKNVEAMLRTQIQMCSNISMIYSGSNRHMLVSMFNDYARPFYQSTGFLFLDKIDNKRYRDFIAGHFMQSGKEISPKALDLIFDLTIGYTYFVQEMCNRLYAGDVTHIDEQTVSAAMYKILTERAPLYQVYRNLLTRPQYDLLKAIAAETEVEKPTASDWLRRYNLGAASSVMRSLDALVAKDLIIYENNKYSFNDIFLMRWLQRY